MHLPTMEEKDIIQGCARQDRSAQEALYNKYALKMKGICLRYCHTSFEAEDVFQEAFVKIFRNIGQYKWKGSFEGWVRRIVINAAVDHYKKNTYLDNHLSVESIDEKDFDAIAIASEMEINDLLNIINKLPHGYRVVFNLFAIDGYSHQEIADMLKISEGTSKSQVAKARKYIQKSLLETDPLSNEKRSARGAR